MGAERAHILIVEDDHDLRDSLEEVLIEEGYGVSTADDGLEALAQLSHQPQRFALVLLDLMMPNMNGLQFREEQLRDPAMAAIPVVVLTASAPALGKTMPGLAAYIRKPLKIQKLLDVIAEILAPPAL